MRGFAFAICIIAVIAIFAGAVWGKYAQDLSVTTELKVTVADYTINKTKMQTVLRSLSLKPTSIKFVTGASVPSGLTNLATTSVNGASTAGIQENEGSKIGVYQSSDGNTLYIAPMQENGTAANNSYVMYTPVDASNFLNGYSSYTYLGDFLTEIDFANLNTSRTTNMTGFFSRLAKLTTLTNFTNVTTDKVTTFTDMFYNAQSLTSLDVSHFNTSSATTLSCMFQSCTNLTSITGLDSETFNTSSVTNLNRMFENCNSLISLDLSKFNTGSVSNMKDMFLYCCKLQEITLGENFDFVGTDGYLPTPSATYISGADGNWYDTVTGTDYTPANQASYHNSLGKTRTYVAVWKTYTIDKSKMWSALKNLSTHPTTLKFAKGSDVSSDYTNISTAGIQADGSGTIGVYQSSDKNTILIAPTESNDFPMYSPEDSQYFLNGANGYCALMNTCTALDVSNLNTSKTTYMESFFLYLQNVTDITGLGENFDTSKVTSFYQMFYDCRKLTSLDVSNFNTSSATNFGRMFSGCYVLQSLDLKNFDTSSAITFLEMFYNCQTLTKLDLTSFDSSGVTPMARMFSQCKNLETIVVSSKFVTDQVRSSTGMFDNCTSLVGGAGTSYDSNYIDKTYARIDTASTPGYFTAKN